jgi:hypothetical protein
MNASTQPVELPLKRRTAREKGHDHVGVGADATPDANTVRKRRDQRDGVIRRVDERN